MVVFNVLAERAKRITNLRAPSSGDQTGKRSELQGMQGKRVWLGKVTPRFYYVLFSPFLPKTLLNVLKFLLLSVLTTAAAAFAALALLDAPEEGDAARGEPRGP